MSEPFSVEQARALHEALAGGLLRILDQDPEQVADWVWDGCPGSHLLDLIPLLPSLLSNAETVLWHDDVWALSQRGASAWMGHALQEEHLPATPQFWIWSGDVRLNEARYDVPGGYEALGLLLDRVRDLGNLSKVPLRETPRMRQAGSGTPSGRLGMRAIWFCTQTAAATARLPRTLLRATPALYVGEPIHWYYYESVAARRFYELPIAQIETTVPDRHERRRRRRDGRPEGAVRVVTLRPLAPRESEDSRDVSWSCRWMVRGHWRKQYHPSDGSRRLRWVDPYVKGPEGLPLKTDRPRVYEVSRGA